MPKKRVFTLSEERVLSAMYQLNRWATANEIAKWAGRMSWNTAKKVLWKKLYKKKLVEKKSIGGQVYWRI